MEQNIRCLPFDKLSGQYALHTRGFLTKDAEKYAESEHCPSLYPNLWAPGGQIRKFAEVDKGCFGNDEVLSVSGGVSTFQSSGIQWCGIHIPKIDFSSPDKRIMLPGCICCHCHKSGPDMRTLADVLRHSVVEHGYPFMLECGLRAVVIKTQGTRIFIRAEDGSKWWDDISGLGGKLPGTSQKRISHPLLKAGTPDIVDFAGFARISRIGYLNGRILYKAECKTCGVKEILSPQEMMEHAKSVHGQKFITKIYGSAEATDIPEKEKLGGRARKFRLVSNRRRNIVCHDHLGNEFPSVSAMCRKYGISVSLYQRREGQGWSIEDILTKPPKANRSLQSYIGQRAVSDEGMEVEIVKGWIGEHRQSWFEVKSDDGDTFQILKRNFMNHFALRGIA